MNRCTCRVLIALCLLGAVNPAAAQHDQHDPGPLPKYVAEPITLFKVGLGPFTRKISSTNPEAQAFFDQGFQMMYAFAKLDAVRSFREAWKRDPECAICYWGEGWAWGSYLNGPMSAEQSPFAYAATQKALALKDKATPSERAFIDALAVRYVKDFDVKKRVEQDSAYAEAMRKVYEKYPDDLDAGTLYADALFLLEPRRGTRDVNAPNIKRLHGVLESVLAKDARHPGACHLYVHATESTVRPDKAEACAAFLGKSIPGASHINHMPSHTFNEVGRWGDSVRANLDAWHSDQKADVGEGFAIYPDHNLHMLLYAASMDGQGAIAMQAGRDYARRTNDTMYQVLTALRFGRFDEVLAVTKRPEREVPGAVWDFAQGYAQLRKGATGLCPRLSRARPEGRGDVEGRIPQPPGQASARRARWHPRRRDRARRQGSAGRHRRVRACRDRWTTSSSTTSRSRCPSRRDTGWAPPCSKPAAPPMPSVIYREDLKDHPHNGWSLLGLQQALKAQGKTDCGSRRRPRRELVAIGHVDSRFAVLITRIGRDYAEGRVIRVINPDTPSIRVIVARHPTGIH